MTHRVPVLDASENVFKPILIIIVDNTVWFKVIAFVASLDLHIQKLLFELLRFLQLRDLLYLLSHANLEEVS